MYFPVYISQMGVSTQLAKGVPDWLEKVEACTGCRQCEKRCPFHLEIVKGIRQSLEQARRLAEGA
jgi:predicted aldo/keto reductase-like oxidoreductase